MTANLPASLRRIVPSAVLCLTIAAFAGACGNSSDSGATASSGKKDTATVEKFSSDVTTSLDPASPQFDYAKYMPTTPVTLRKHARIAVITSSLASAQAVQFADAVKDAAGKVGWTAEAFDGKYSVDVQSSLISQAVQGRVDGIVIAGIAPTTVSSPIAAAAAAHIPVINMFGYGDEDNGVTDIGADPKLVGAEVGKWIVVKSDGAANVAVFELPPGGAASVSINAYQGALAAVVDDCTGCSVIKETVPITDATAPGTPRYVAFLKNHPKGKLDYVAAGFDTGMIAYAKTDQQLGRLEIKTIGGLAASEAGVAEIVNQTGPVVVPAVPLGFVALATVDAIARRNAGQEVERILLPAPLINAANASKFPKGVFTPATDYAAAFAALWK
ncbi:sugar ABC transporter substrate-binding protein [Streptomyces sp. NPDC055722]